MDQFDDLTDAEESAEAQRIAADLRRLGPTDLADRDAVVRLARLRVLHRRLSADVAEHGVSQTLDNGRAMPRPEASMMLQASRECRDLEAALRLTSKARASRKPVVETGDDDPLAEIERARRARLAERN